MRPTLPPPDHDMPGGEVDLGEGFPDEVRKVYDQPPL
jgi:hypothetical protein